MRAHARSTALIAAAWCAAGEAACPDIPAIRYEQAHIDAYAPGCNLNPLSYVPLWDAARYVSFGGEVRHRYEYTHNPKFGLDPQDAHGTWLQRYALHSDLHWGSHLRAFVELHSALENGRAGGPSPVDENVLDLQNAFLEGRFSLARDTDIHLRAGRQEMELGSARLISVRGGPNVRRTFDGLRVLMKTGPWLINALAVRPRRDRDGAFDDSTNDSQLLWGFYATRAPTDAQPLGFDTYYLVRENDAGVYDQGANSERRHTMGVRLFGANRGWRWNVESMLQFGEFGGGDIRAWSIASEAGYAWSERMWQPVVRINANIASGDRDPNNPDLQSFHPLYPRGNYFSEDATLGPHNFYNAHLYLTLHPCGICSVTADYNVFWRLSTTDGVYAPNGSLLRSAGGSDERLVATALSVTSEWTINRYFSLTAIYAHVSPRRFLEQTGPAAAVEFFELTARFRF